jgi:hypothetical protein
VLQQQQQQQTAGHCQQLPSAKDVLQQAVWVLLPFKQQQHLARQHSKPASRCTGGVGEGGTGYLHLRVLACGQVFNK